MNAMVRNLVARLRLQPQDEGGPSRMEMLRQRSEAADTLEAMSRTAVNRNRVIRRLRRRCERRLKLANRGAPYKVIEFLLHMQKHEFVCPLCKGSGKLKTYIDRPKTRIRCEMSKPLSETGAGETSPAAACSADRGHCYARTRAQDCVGDLERALSDQWVLENQPILWLNFGNGLLQDLFCKRAGVVGRPNEHVTDGQSCEVCLHDCRRHDRSREEAMKTTKCYMGEHCLHFGELDLAVETRKINGTYRNARILWESDYRKLMKLVREIAKRKCWAMSPVGYCGATHNLCDPCRARKLLEKKP